tara:strand:+ start:32008 stop:32238 length:231 start_codon:yes stop_codon:yes gene_type:complete
MIVKWYYFMVNLTRRKKMKEQRIKTQLNLIELAKQNIETLKEALSNPRCRKVAQWKDGIRQWEECIEAAQNIIKGL